MELSIRSKSISTRFNLALVAIVAVIMMAFAGIATLITIDRISKQLDAKLDGLMRISSVGLQAPLWNFDNSIIQGYVESLMLDKSIVFAGVTSGDGSVFRRIHPDIKDQKFEQLAKSDNYTVRSSKIFKDEKEIGQIRLAVSRAAMREEIFSNIAAIIGLTLAVLTTIMIASIVISRRYIVRPLSALQASASAIGSGDLQTSVDTTGQDEIGHLARAFETMRNSIRDLVGELRRTNDDLESANQNLEERVEQRTQEVVASQQKLVDAIGSTSEGFAFFDAEDRLVLHNAQYVNLLYGGSDFEIAPGMSFEEIVRAGIQKGLISTDSKDEEAYIQDRIAKHRNPEAVILQRRDGDKWIQISEHRTGDGGTVAVFSDVSALKNREADLTEKTTMLEHLSNQLAKYLSPQIYDSIFQGKQEVRVASSRKKLTVFFSDIEGFTETAERMESEELTNLLNSYLTEMSRIALEHGATIDKYVGDAILIFFGDPESRGVKQDAVACVRMAMAMAQRMTELQDEWRSSGILDPLQCRMGIHTDYCTVGNFGSESRMDYTIIGRGVNTAARLESAADTGKILISYPTYALVSDEIPCVARGQVEVKGIARPVDVYEVSVDGTKSAELVKLPAANGKLEFDIEVLSSAERAKFQKLLEGLLAKLSEHDTLPARSADKHLN